MNIFSTDLLGVENITLFIAGGTIETGILGVQISAELGVPYTSNEQLDNLKAFELKQNTIFFSSMFLLHWFIHLFL